uniref:Uncharacterized protein n=1 Tax=Anguilla anguilla TaxID=7936 RepID=A0A0E9TSG3_ANGAN
MFTLKRTLPVRGPRMLILKRPFFPNVIKCVYMCNFPHAMYFLNYLDLPLCLPCSTWPLSVE